MVPAYYERLDTIPMLPSHKADRKKLPPPSRGRLVAGGNGHVPPAGELERVIAASLAELLGVERVSVTDDFFEDLGGHSLLMARFCARVRERAGSQIGMQDVYMNPTTRELATLLASRAASDGRPSDQPARTVPPSHVPTRLAYYGCGAAQALIYLAGLALGVGAADVALGWILEAGGPGERYLRTCAALFLGLLLGTLVPVAAKWLLVGRWKEEELPVWGPRYLRFWFVKNLVRFSPLAFLKGYPIYNVYLRLLGARIGRGAVVECRAVPIGTDLLEIGAGTILRKDSIVPGYRVERGRVRLGPIRIGRDCFVGEGTTIDVDTRMEDGAELGHASSLQVGQVVPAGESWHGSPAQACRTRYCALPRLPLGDFRRAVYSTVILVVPLFVAAPLALWAIGVGWTAWSEAVKAHPLALGPWALGVYALAASYALGLFGVLVLPRVLHPLLERGRVYPLFGWRYFVFKLLQLSGNSHQLNLLFGDSSAIVHYLRAIGWNLCEVFQTGSNFGVAQRQDDPLSCKVGSRTMVSDGLSMINVQMSSTSFVLRGTEIGARNYLGNNIHYPPDSRVGENCLLATKVMIPIDGPLREDVGLLGSPCFHIPRRSERDRELSPLEEEALRHAGLPRKNRHNLVTALLFLAGRWGFLAGLLGIGLLADRAYETHDVAAPIVALVAALGFTVLWYTGLEWVGLGFRRMRPVNTSIYDPRFWRVERYWKLSEARLLALFKGTPLKNVITRMLGVRLGRMVFDDGFFASEKTLVEIGDYCTLADGSTLQSHSLEEGLFKCDRIRIGARCTISASAFVHYGVDMGDDVVLDPDSFLMKGESPPAGSVWRGNPARAVHTRSERGAQDAAPVVPRDEIPSLDVRGRPAARDPRPVRGSGVAASAGA